MRDTPFVGDNDHGDAVPTPHDVVMEQIKSQRDEARRWVCIMKAQSVTYAYSPEHFAQQHGWDCFDGMPNPWSQKGASDE